MEIKVRNIDANIIEKIDILAKENKLSREEFLRLKLDEVAYKKEKNELEEKYNLLMENLEEMFITHMKIMGIFIEEYLINPEYVFDYDLEDFLDEYNLDTIEDDIHNLKNKPKELTDLQIKQNYNLQQKTEIRIRNVPLDVSERIKELAEIKNISQNEFLNRHLRKLTYSKTLQSVDDKYSDMIEKTLRLLYYSNKIMAIYKEENIYD